MMYSKETAYEVLNIQSKVSVTDTETSFNPAGVITEIHNAGDNTIYIKAIPGVTTDNYELLAGEKMMITNKLYLICGTGLTSTLKTIGVR